MKPGWKTTEFWLAVTTQVIGLLVVTGIMNPTSAHTVGDAVSNSISSAASIIANAVIVFGYVKSRNELKRSELGVSKNLGNRK